jgi:hypothetical protein
MPYCSSDSWSGNRSNATSFGFFFRGKVILQSILEDLKGRIQASSKKGLTEVILSGISAGGMGVLTNIDFVRRLIHKTMPSVRVIGMMDGGWFLDAVPFGYCEYAGTDKDITDCLEELADGRLVSIGEQARLGYELWTGQVDDSCREANPHHPHLCYLADSAFAYVSTPTVVHEFQTDCWQMMYNGVQAVTSPKIWCSKYAHNGSVHLNQSQQIYVKNFKKLLRGSLVKNIGPPHALFSPACMRHASWLGPSFTQLRLPSTGMRRGDKASGGNWGIATSSQRRSVNLSLSDVLGEFIAGSPLQVVDGCSGRLDCTPGCYLQ